MKSLIVEDDPVSRRLLENILEKHGDVVSVDNGASAVEKFVQQLNAPSHFELVCLDIMMPGMDGHEVLRRIREEEDVRGLSNDKSVKVIMTTAVDDSESVLRAYTGRCAAYCVKPIDIVEFYDHLEKLGLIHA